MQKERISAFELFALLYFCRMLTAVTFSPLFGDTTLNADTLMNIVFAGVFILLFCIPAVLFYKRFPDKTPVEIITERNRGVSLISTLFYVAFFLYAAAFSVSRFFIFLTSVIYPEKDMTVFLIVAILVCAYATYLGIEALARGNVILLLITVLGVFAVLFSVSPKISVYNLEPLFYYPVGESVKNGLFAAARTVEISLFLILCKRTNGKMKKAFIGFFSLFIISTLVLFFYLNSVSGEFAKTQLFPFYSLAVIARFPFIERLDAVVTAFWIFSILIKCALLIFISSSLIEYRFSLKKRVPVIICFCVITALALAFSVNLTIHKSAGNPLIYLIFTIVGAVIIPVVCLLFKRRETAK